MAHTGIYKITHTSTGKCYVGQSRDIELRWRDHRKSLLAGRHHCAYLQRAWHKYGAEAFSFTIVQQCAEHMLDYFEQLYMRKYAINGLFNARGAGARGRHTLESRAKMSASQRKRFTADPATRERQREIAIEQHADPTISERRSAGMRAAWERDRHKRAGVSHHNNRAVMCLDTGEVYKSIALAEAATGIKQDALSEGLRKQRPVAQKHWAYVEEADEVRSAYNALYAAGHRRRGHPVINLATMEEYPSATEASKVLGYSTEALRVALKCNRAFAGAQWRYKQIVL